MMKFMVLISALTFLLSAPVLAAEKGPTISGESSISGTKFSKGASASKSTGSKIGPHAGNIDNEDTIKKPKKEASVEVETEVSPPVAATKPVAADSNPYGSAPAASMTAKATIDSDGNDLGTVNSITGAAIDSDGNAVTPETQSADTNKDGRASNSELNNAANGGDIHSIHR